MSQRYPPEGASRNARAASAHSGTGTSPTDQLVREARRLLAQRAHDQVVAKLEVHRPAEWTGVDEAQARLIRLLGQGYLGQGRASEARDCLEHLHGAQEERAILSQNEYAGVLSDLAKCCRAQGQEEAARHYQELARRTLQSGE